MMLSLFIMKLEMRTFTDFYSVPAILHWKMTTKKFFVCLYFAYFILCTQKDFFLELHI